ncbi:MAG: ketol-acid reductoisomerase [Candidatus Diapherotrites archaeon]
MKLFYDADADLGVLKGKTVAIIGFGSQGKNQGLCMRDSGVKVVYGLREGGKSFENAKKEGFEVYPISEAVQKADIVHVLIPDETHNEVFEQQIKPKLSAGKTLSFSHGFSIVFKQIVPPKNVDVLMVAPKSPGSEERKRFLEGFGVPGLIAIKQDASGKAKETALAMAKACGFTRAGVLECTFEQEAYEDLFGEQTVLCGGVVELIKAGFETLVDAGYPPEMAYFECLHEMKLIIDLIYAGGIEGMYAGVSNTAEFGGRTVGSKIINSESKKAMKEALRRVESGEFAKQWMDEYKAGLPNFKKWKEEGKNHLIEKTGEKIRALFSKKA